MKLKNFTTLEEYAKAKAAASCSPEKDYFSNLCNFITSSIIDRLANTFLKEENTRIEQVYKKFVICQIVRENGEIDERDNKFTIQTPGLVIKDTDIQNLYVLDYGCEVGTYLYYINNTKEEYLLDDELDQIINYFRSKGMVKQDINEVEISECNLFEVFK